MGSSYKLTVYFENPFWVAIAEEEDASGYRAARYVFGPEPTQPEVEELVLSRWAHLRFSKTMQFEKNATKPMGYKRARREAKKEMSQSRKNGTKAQQALQAQYEESKEAIKKTRSLRRTQEKDAAFAIRKEKRRQKARGH